MVKTDNAENFVADRLTQLQRQQDEAADRRRLLKQQVDQLEQEIVATEQRLARARSFDLHAGICPRCYIEDGVRNDLKAIRADEMALNIIPASSDLMRCTKRDCPWHDTVTV